MGLFPQADRGIVVLCEKDQLGNPAQCSRVPDRDTPHTFSRTVAHRALTEGIGILSADAIADVRFQSSETVAALHLRSIVCVPLICQDGRRLGVLQLDCLQPGNAFQVEDLQLVTAVGLQAAVVLDNAALHAEVLREATPAPRTVLARDIQSGMLPTNFPAPAETGIELYACVHPAKSRAISTTFFSFRARSWPFLWAMWPARAFPRHYSWWRCGPCAETSPWPVHRRRRRSNSSIPLWRRATNPASSSP